MSHPRHWRWLLLMYPPDLRRDHGDEILFAVTQSWRDQRGAAARMRWLAHVVADFVRSWPRARRSPLSPHPHPLPPSRRGLRFASIADDVKAAARMFRHAPGFAAGAVVTMSLGIGASAAIFSLADATLLHPLPVPEAHRVLQLTWSSSHPDFRDISSQQKVFSETAAWASRDVGIEIDGRTISVRATAVAGDYFGIAAARPAAGRLLTDRDNERGAPLAAVLGDRAWQRLFGGDPSIVGRTVRVNQHPVQIVGVVPRPFRGFTLAESPDLYLPLGTMAQLATDFFSKVAEGPDLLENRGVVFLQMIGRLRPGVSPEQADLEVERLYRQLHPPQNTSEPVERLTLTSLPARATGLDRADDLRRFVRVLGGATLLTLLLACVSVAGLLLVRAESRQRELGVRAALGAGRWRMIRLLLVESLAIGLGAAGLGTAVAYVCVSLLGAFSLPGAIAIRDLGLTVNSTVLIVSAALGILTSLVFGLAPLGAVARADALAAVRDRTRVTARQPLRSAFVAAQIVLCVLLFGGGLAFARAVQHAFAIDFGFDTTNVALVTANPSLVRYSRDQTLAYQRQSLDRLRSVPWISAAAWSNMRPLRGRMTAQMNAEGAAPVPERDRNFDANAVSDGYFEALAIPLLSGRTFQPADNVAGAARVAVLSARAAAKLFPGGNALGSRVSSDPTAKSPVWITVVGIVGDIRRGLERQPDPIIYMPIAQMQWTLDLGPVYLFVRSTTIPAEQAVGDAASLLMQVDPAVAITLRQTMREHVGATAMTHRLGFTLFALFAALAATLTTFGVYGVVASAIGKRTREIGIRMALGANAPGVVRLVVTQGLWPVAAGLVIGTLAFWWFSGALAQFLLSVPAFDALSVAGTIAAILGIAVIAILIPARRALSIDPAVTLRSE